MPEHFNAQVIGFWKQWKVEQQKLWDPVFHKTNPIYVSNLTLPLPDNLELSIKQQRQFRTVLFAMSLTMPKLLLLTTHLENGAVLQRSSDFSKFETCSQMSQNKQFLRL